MLFLCRDETLLPVPALHPQLGYDLDQNPADLLEALSDMGLADVFDEARLNRWVKKHQLHAVIDTTGQLFTQRAARDVWESVFDESFTDHEWAILSSLLLKGRGDDIEEKDQEINGLEGKLSNSRDYGLGMTGLAIAFLFSSVFDGKNDPLSDSFPPAQLQTLTPEQIEVLRQKTEFFLQQNQEIDRAVAK